MNVIVIVNGRPRLLQQTVGSLLANAQPRGLFQSGAYTLTIVVDASDVYDASIGAYVASLGAQDWCCIHHATEPLGVGGAKNRGAFITQAAAEQGIFCLHEHVMFCDADLYALPGWNLTLKLALAAWPELALLGGWCHPFLRSNATVIKGGITFEVPDAIPGVCMAMPWTVWNQHTPKERAGAFMDNCTGPGQSEDWQLCQRVKEAGQSIAAVTPYPMIHCGMINSAGEPACGHEAMRALVHVQAAENRLFATEIPAFGGFIMEGKADGGH